MAVNDVRVGTEGASLLRTIYDAEIRNAAVEEGIIGPDIPLADVQTAGRTMTLRTIPAVTAQTLGVTAGSSSQSSSANLTYETGTVTTVSGNAVVRYAAVSLPNALIDALISPDKAAVRSGYRIGMQAALEEAEDVYFGTQLFLNVGTTKGPGNIDKTALLDLLQTLRVNAKQHYKNGMQVHFKYHPTQIKHIGNIDILNNAELRGDDENPNVKGFFSKGLGMTFAETANVPLSVGSYWNCAFLPTAFRKAYNQERTVLAPQPDGLSVLYHAYVDVVGVEAFDLDAIVHKTA